MELIKNFSEIFWTFSVLPKKLRRGCLISSLHFHTNVWWFCFGKATFLFNTFRIWTKNYPTFGGKKSASLSKMQSGCPRENFERKTTFFGKKTICSSSSFLDYRPNFFRTLVKLFQHSCPNCISLVHGRSMSKIIYLRKIISIFIFKNIVEKSGLLSKKTADSSKLHSRCPEERFEEK